jgi:hypothetical protein
LAMAMPSLNRSVTSLERPNFTRKISRTTIMA